MSNLTTRLYQPSDYPRIAEWWRLHLQEPVPEAVLPKCGVLVCGEDGEPMAAVWIYQDNSVGVAWLAWLVSDAKTPAFHVESALKVLLGAAESVARANGYKVIFTWTDRRSMKRWFAAQGYVRSCEDAVGFVKKL